MPYAALKIIGGSGWRYLADESAGRCWHECTLVSPWQGMGIQRDTVRKSMIIVVLLYFRHVFRPSNFRLLRNFQRKMPAAGLKSCRQRPGFYQRFVILSQYLSPH